MTVWIPNDDGYANLASHDSFLQGAPYNTFARLRRDDPCAWSDWDGGEGFWNITRYNDIMALNKLPDIMSSAQGIRMEDQSYEEYLARRTFQETDPPEHSKTRMKVNRAFAKPVMARFEDQIRELCVSILDDVLDEPEFDATDKIARQLPLQMLGLILGTPAEDMEWLVEKGDALIENTDPQYTTHVLDKMNTDEFRMMPFNSPAGAELYVYAKDFMAQKKVKADEGILSLILQPDADGNTLTQEEFRNTFCLFVAAGNDTTRYSIAAGIQALCHQPELLAQLKAGGDIWDTVADEIIRWASPTMYFRRTATQDYEMHGKTIREGQKVLYWFVSGNRDETVFSDPYCVDPNRTPNRHMSFGQGGPHVCLGMWLAKLEVKILMQELVKRIDRIEAAGPELYLRSNFIGGIKSLPIRIVRS